MKYDALIGFAEGKHIKVKEADLHLYDGLIKGRTIAIRRDQPRRKKACVLAEELGHVFTSSGDIIDYADPNSQKQETKARTAGYDLLIGLDGIIKAYKAGCANCYEMAGYLEVTEEFLRDAISRYRDKYGVYAVHEGYCVIFEPSLAVIKLL